MVEVAQQVQMLLGPRAGGRGRSTSPNVTTRAGRSTSPNVRAGGKGRSTSPNVTQG